MLAACSESANDGAGSGGTGGGVGGTGGTEALGGAGGEGGDEGASEVWLTLWDVSYLDGVFVAVGSIADLQHRDGLILTSDDGHHWSEAYRGEELDLKNVAGGGSRWVALDGGDLDPPQTNVVTSEDGLSWQQLAESPPFASAEVIWTGSKFLALGFGLVPPGPYDPEESIPEPLLWESTTGSAWEQFGELGSQHVPAFEVARMVVAPPGIVAGGNHGIGVSADDGGSWNWTSFRDLTGEEYVLGNVTAAYWDGTRFGATTTYDCCYGEVAGARKFYRLSSDDGLDWAWEEASDAFYSVTFRGEVGVATGWSSGGIVHTSGGGEWTHLDTVVRPLAITNGEGSDGERFVAVGESIWFSEDGTEWAEADLTEVDLRVSASN